MTVCLAMLARTEGVMARAHTSPVPSGVAHAAWHQLVGEAAFEARDTSEAFVFQGRMWLSNGYFGSGTASYRDLWTSADGVGWTRVSARTPYPPYSEIVVFKNRLFAIRESVWTSDDGVTWTRIAERTPFGRRGGGNVVVFDDRMWQLGSGDDVWYSRDGVEWICATAHAPYGRRNDGVVQVFRDRLWVIGGWTHQPGTPREKRYADLTSLNDVWNSTDGIHWTRVLEHAPWAPRTWAGSAVYDQRLWIVGGFSSQEDVNLNGTWSTVDGETWTRLPVTQAFTERHQPAVFSFSGSLWIVGGNTWPLRNDVWRLSLRSQPVEEDVVD